MGSSEILSKLVEEGVLVSPDLFDKDIDESVLKKIVKQELDFLDENKLKEFYDVKEEEQKIEIKKGNVNIIRSYDKPPRKRTFQDFVAVFNLRYNNIAEMLKKRQDLQGLTSISRLQQKMRNDKVAIIGMILSKVKTKNNNIIMAVEDITGITNVVITKGDRNKEIYALAENLVLDEVIGITGTWGSSAIFPNSIIFPDIPLNKELKKQQEEEYVVFLGDTHFGSKVFMKEEFEKFLEWIQGRAGNEEQKRVAEKVRYVILPGDIIEGVGIYPSQEEDLEIIDVSEQYEEAVKWLKRIPERIQIIAMSGNHDAGRLSEPQEVPFKDLASELWKMPNITLVSNPSYVNIGKTDIFPGFDILLYHGGSLIYYADNIPSIRAKGGQKRADLIMKFQLQRRHLAPTHGSTLYLPDAEQDYLLIDIVPDIFVTGHIHRASVATYRNITMINASCWTETTEDQIKRGLEPLPARIPIINLKTREVKVLNFLTKKSKEKELEAMKEINKLGAEE